MNSLKAAFDNLSELLKGKNSYFLTIIGLFVYHVLFDKQLTCLTEPGVNPKDWSTEYECNIYIAMPPFILFFLILWLDGEFQQVWTIVYRCGSDFWLRLFSALFKATAIGFLWVVSVFLDGDWYACQHREELLGLNNTYSNMHLKRQSVVIGLGMTLGLVFLVVIFNAVPYWCYHCPCCKKMKEFCTKKNCCLTCRDTLSSSYHQVLFEENNLIEKENMIKTYIKITAENYVLQKGKDLLQPTSDPGEQGNSTQGEVGQSSDPNPPLNSQASSTGSINVDKINDLLFDRMKSDNPQGVTTTSPSTDSCATEMIPLKPTTR